MYVVERRSPRFPFIASAQVVETRTEARLQARTSDLSREGCYLDMLNPLPIGTRQRIQHVEVAAFATEVARSGLQPGFRSRFNYLGRRDEWKSWGSALHNVHGSSNF